MIRYVEFCPYCDQPFFGKGKWPLRKERAQRQVKDHLHQGCQAQKNLIGEVLQKVDRVVIRAEEKQLQRLGISARPK